MVSASNSRAVDATTLARARDRERDRDFLLERGLAFGVSIIGTEISTSTPSAGLSVALSSGIAIEEIRWIEDSDSPDIRRR